MRLLWIELHGYRRFVRRTRIYIDSHVIALLGPNESGKTSVLHALTRCTGQGVFTPADFSRSDVDESVPIVTARFLLDSEDAAALAILPLSFSPVEVTVERYRSGDTKIDLCPAIPVDLSYDAATAALDEMSESASWQQLMDCIARARGDAFTSEYAKKLSSAAPKIFQRYQESGNDKDVIIDMGERLICESAIKAIRRRVSEIVKKRLPPMLLFRDEARQLSDVYQLSELDKVIPESLSNLMSMAGLDYARLRHALSVNYPQAQDILDSANRNLVRVLGKAWSQDEIEVRLHVHGGELRVTVKSNDHSFDLSSRSAGLRQFIALTAFLMKSHAVRPVLLIDEVEAQLHYDAQADYIRLLAEHRLIEQVVYSTHSYGALPDDLLHGVRMLRIDGNASSVVNWFWTEQNTGLSQLLVGIGASTMAFVPMRNAVFAEGPSDMILLPLLLKIAAERPMLGFQILQGVANLSDHRVIELQKNAPNVAYCLDDDDSGRSRKGRLIAAGVAPNKVQLLSIPGQTDTVIEDCLAPACYLRAVNDVLRRRGATIELKSDDIASSRRPAALEKWCAVKGVAVPDKRDVAVAVFNINRESPAEEIVDLRGAEALRALLERLDASVGIRARLH